MRVPPLARVLVWSLLGGEFGAPGDGVTDEACLEEIRVEICAPVLFGSYVIMDLVRDSGHSHGTLDGGIGLPRCAIGLIGSTDVGHPVGGAALAASGAAWQLLTPAPASGSLITHRTKWN